VSRALFGGQYLVVLLQPRYAAGISEETMMFPWLKREPKELVEQRQVLSPALMDYPLYQPPHCLGAFLSRRDDQTDEDYERYRLEYAEHMKVNFAYFMAQRATRIAALQSFLSKLGVNASFDDAGLTRVSAWFPDNAFALADLREWAVSQSYYQMQTPWTEGLLGLNIIFDLGVFVGDLLIQKQPRLHWVDVPRVSDTGECSATPYKIEGFRRQAKRKWLGPADYILGLCWNDLNDLHSYAPLPKARRNYDVLVGVVRAYSTR
jgi:hypothetical protein